VVWAEDAEIPHLRPPASPTRQVTIVDAIDDMRSISQDFTDFYVELEPGSGERIREKRVRP
jgi:hypothetical protein